MTNHHLIINPLFVIINLAGLAYLSLELLSETLLPIWLAGESSTNTNAIFLIDIRESPSPFPSPPPWWRGRGEGDQRQMT